MVQIISTFEQDADTLYELYKTLFYAALPLWKRAGMLNTMMGGYESSWRVIGVAQSAIDSIRDFHARKQERMGVSRAHIVQRRLIVETIFRDLQSREDFIRLFQRDFTVLVGKGGNTKIIPVDLQVYPLPLSENLFRCAQVGFCYGPKEKEWLKQLKVKPIRLEDLLRKIDGAVNPRMSSISPVLID